MGLDVTHGCWQGSYSAFNRFRDALWRVTYPENPGGWQNMPSGAFKAFPSDEPMDYLFYHSDCEGDLEVWMLQPLADRLEAIATALPADGTGHLARLGIRGTALQFAKGCREAAAAGESVELY